MADLRRVSAAIILTSRVPIVEERSTRTRVVVLALLGALVGAAVVIGSAFISGEGLPRLISASADGTASAVIKHDFPGARLDDTSGHDGQQMYAVARQPMHLKDTLPSLDRPRYRLQRILLPVLAWALHPSGGGPGLAWALVVVGVASLILGGVALGLLATDGGGAAKVAVVFGVMPGALVTLSIGGADMLALSLGLTAILLCDRRKWVWAAVAAAAAVLAKESVFVLLASWSFGQMWLTRPDWRRRIVAAAVVPAAVGGAWWLYLRALLPQKTPQVIEFTAPFVGWWRAWTDGWSTGQGVTSLVTFLLTLGLAGYALRRVGLRSSWSWPVIGMGLFLTVLDLQVIGPDLNGPRMVAPLLIASILAIQTSPRELSEEFAHA